MPLFSSSSTKEGGHNKLGKHTRGSSLTARKASVGHKGAVAEDASTRAMAGSQSRIMHDDSTGAENNVKPMTPKSLNGEQELNEIPPTPPPHDANYGKGNTYDGTYPEETKRDSMGTTSSTTWRASPEAAAMRTGGGHNDTGTGYGMVESEGAPVNRTHGLTGDRPADLATARHKIQFAIEAELAADRALELARGAVEDARATVAALEKQVSEEFERAHSKKTQTDEVVRDLGKLGRHNR